MYLFFLQSIVHSAGNIKNNEVFYSMSDTLALAPQMDLEGKDCNLQLFVGQDWHSAMSQMIYDLKFCDSVADLLVNFGQFW